MGAKQSKEEQLYQEVQKGNHDAVKALRRDGASLEWVDRKGRTPLILSCVRRELLDMAITLLNLGANINAHRPGHYGGFPLHHAAKRGLEKTVTLLLSHGADPLAINDAGETPLDMARARGHTTVVRLLEEQLSIFSGMLRELSGPGILEILMPNLCTKKIWAVVLPSKLHTSSDPTYELVIYVSPKVSLWNRVSPLTSHPAGLCNVAQPRSIIQLSKAEVAVPEMSLLDPSLHITDRVTKAKYKLFSEKEGDKAQLQRLFRACQGIPQSGNIPLSSQALPAPTCVYGNPSQIHPLMLYHSGAPSPALMPFLQNTTATSPNVSNSSKLAPSTTSRLSEEMSLALALDASIHSASEDEISILPDAESPSSVTSYQGWGYLDGILNVCLPTDLKKLEEKYSYGCWEEGNKRNSCNGWGPAEAETNWPEPSTKVWLQNSSVRLPFTFRKDKKQMHVASPSAPPLPYVLACDDACISGSCGDALVEVDYSSTGSGARTFNGRCIVCWDGPAEGACIPCGHMASCMSCLSEITTKNWGCPVCRASIQQIIKVYAV
eukprot:c26249_g1_i2 orf=791-2440(+)